jgi:hypothetical protein
MNIVVGLGTINYFLGGNINSILATDTAVNPALRKSAWSLFTNALADGDAVREFISNDVTGVCYNPHYGLEPDWRNACWGSKYARLLSLRLHQEQFLHSHLVLAKLALQQPRHLQS